MKKENIQILKNGGIGVIPTDTIYGLVGSALKIETVERIKQIKGRSANKGYIVLISSLADLKMFDIDISPTVEVFLSKYWPGKISVIFKVDKKFDYLDKDQGLALRLPAKEDLREILKQTGPLIAPSANPEGLLPAKNIFEARKYFEDRVDFYEDGGELESLPSTLVKINGEQIEILRPGAVEIN